MLLEQFGGANGELAAAMQYTIQGLNCEDAARKDLLLDIGTEELSHLEVIGSLARLHLKSTKFEREQAEADPLIAIAGGGGVALVNSQGDPWTSDYLKITGELDVDLRSNMAAEARAKIVYERLLNFCQDAGSKEALQFLMTREIAHLKSFSLALESLGKSPFSIGEIPPTREMARMYFNDSTGAGESGEIDARGPWNEGAEWDFVTSPMAPPEGQIERRQPERVERRTSGVLHDMLALHLQELLDAEQQLLLALPNMASAAKDEGLRSVLLKHRDETETQAERLRRALSLLGSPERRQPCRGMEGLISEGEEIIRQARKEEPAAADLALIAATKNVEHYEMSSYNTARSLAEQIGQNEVAQLLTKTYAEEENAVSQLTECERPLISKAGQLRSRS
jgi:Mn-containing catalase